MVNTELDRGALLDSDQAFMDAIRDKKTIAEANRAAILAYLLHQKGECDCIDFPENEEES